MLKLVNISGTNRKHQRHYVFVTLLSVEHVKSELHIRECDPMCAPLDHMSVRHQDFR